MPGNVDEATLQARAAAARAYALSDQKEPAATSSSSRTAVAAKPKPAPSAAKTSSATATTKSKTDGECFKTPPVRPTPPPTSVARASASSSASNKNNRNNKRKKSPVSVTSTSPSVRRKISPRPTDDGDDDDEDDEYARFVKSLGFDDDLISLPPLPKTDDDDEEEYLNIESDEEDDDDMDDMDVNMLASAGSQQRQQRPPQSPLHFPDTDEAWENNFYSELEAELGGLLEEDMEAAVTTLLGNTTNTQPNKSNEPTSQTTATHDSSKTEPSTPTTATTSSTTRGAVSSPSTPLRESTRASHITESQLARLQKLMAGHYQLLLQQAILAVRAAHVQKTTPKPPPGEARGDLLYGGETPDDLAEILDGAIGMLQDLDQNRKDAIRNSIQLQTADPQNVAGGKRSLLPRLADAAASETTTARRLTRSAFSKTLNSHFTTPRTTFDVKGLAFLKETFQTIDKSVMASGSVVMPQHNRKGRSSSPNSINILEPADHGVACRLLLRQASGEYDERILPGSRDLSQHLCHPQEVLGDDFRPPMTEEQQIQLRKNRNQFSAAEDNLVLRGVNLYGEKQWLLIADRYLPDRSVNIISQRYSKLCLLLYHAHGIYIDAEGNLKSPPKNKSADSLDEEALSKLKRVDPPAILNVHRWSLEEDVTLLKAVPHLGSMWAELSTRFMPHRDRGHLRKRYQVLERRVKATVQRAKKDGSAQQPVTPKTSNSKWSSRTAGEGASRPSGSRSKKKGKGKNNGTNEKMDRSEILPHPGMPQLQGHAMPGPAYAARPSDPSGGKRMPNGSLPPHPGGVVQGKTGLVRKPGFQLPVQRNPTHLLLAAAVNPHFSGMANGNGNKIVKPGEGENGPLYCGDYSEARAPRKDGKSDSLPAASSPELDESGMEAESKQECTRTGFEKLLNEGTNEWSQMSRMKKMMENDTESMVANAIVSNLANAGRDCASGRSAADVIKQMERLPNIEMDSTESSGFSLLHHAGDADANGASPAKVSSRASIMASVLERTNKGGARQDATLGKQNGHAAQQEERAAPDTPIPLHVPSTPSRYISTPSGPGPSLFGGSCHGTPVGLSPALKTGYSPAFMRSGFSPAGNSLMMYGGTASTDGFELCDLVVSDRSRQAWEGNGTGPKPSSRSPMPRSFSHPLTPATPSQFQEGHNLMATDFEAITALNSLSNSPARSLSQRAQSETPARTTPLKDDKGAGINTSFFTKVTQSIKKKDSKKRKS